MSKNLKKELGQALRLHQQGNLIQARQQYLNILQQEPEHVSVLALLGTLAAQQHNYAEAEQLLRRASAKKPQEASIHNNLANVLKAQYKYAQACWHYQQAQGLAPDDIEIVLNLGQLYELIGQPEQAMQLYRPIAQRHPDQLTLQEAVLRCDYASYRYHTVLQRAQKLSQQYPSQARFQAWAGRAYEAFGRLDAAMEHYAAAASLSPDYEVLWLYNSIKDPRLSDSQQAERIQQTAHKKWGEIPSYKHTRQELNPDRRLRIAYVSADLYQHVMANMIGPILRDHHRKHFEIYVYANLSRTDSWTTAFQDLADHWRDISRLDDIAAAQVIQQDQIDILVDLNGYSAGHRLGIFARKPAPIQICGFGWNFTTGLPQMDYFLGDRHLLSAERLNFFSEHPLYLPCHIHWSPHEAYARAPAQPIRRQRKHSEPVRFGSGNAQYKLNQQVLQLWARILLALPQSTLSLKNRELSSRAVQDWTRSVFADAGLDVERLSLQGASGTQEHMAFYQEIDIALDPFPYSGCITTCEALWMGVPVISLNQGNITSPPLLMAVGTPELIASSPDAYLDKAIALAENTDHLAEYSVRLPQALLNSVIADTAGFIKALEDNYRQIWQKACQNKLSPAATGLDL